MVGAKNRCENGLTAGNIYFLAITGLKNKRKYQRRKIHGGGEAISFHPIV